MKLLWAIAAVLTTVHGAKFTLVNNAPSTIWIGCLGNAGMQPLNGGGWEMASGAEMTVESEETWGGRFWARTGCNFDENGKGHCDTGDCGDVLKCDGNGGAPPVTLAEVTLNGWGNSDYYDVSNVDGFNIPVTMAPIGKTGDEYRCTAATCTANINDACPDELRQVVNGQTVGCKSACLAFNTDQYCCRNAYGTAKTCIAKEWPVDYSKFFKTQCPKAYSYAYDDKDSTFTCSEADYKITFG